MKKNLEKLGIALSREESKKVIGGDTEPEPGGACKSTTTNCTYIVSPGSTTTATGKCAVYTAPMRNGCGCKRADDVVEPDTSCYTDVE